MQVKSFSFEQSLLGQIGRLAHQVERQLETTLTVRFNLTVSQFRVLMALGGLGETSQRALVDELGLSAALVTRQVDALVSRGLMLQKQNPASRRENMIKLTVKGERAVEELTAAMREVQHAVFAELGLEQETVLARTLEALLSQRR